MAVCVSFTSQVIPPNMGKCNIVNGPHHVLWMGDLNYRIDWGQQVSLRAWDGEGVDGG